MKNIEYLIKFWNNEKCLFKVFVKDLFYSKKGNINGINIIKIIVKNIKYKITGIEIFEYYNFNVSNTNYIGLGKINKVKSECNFDNIKFN